MKLNHLENICRDFITDQDQPDAAHDLAHTQRVVANAKKLLGTEKADDEIVVAAAWLHDCLVLPKNHAGRNKASALAAEKAVNFLMNTEFPETKLNGVHHAIESHSFSANIVPKTIEAQIVQDADRIDALGAIGIARCFTVGGQLDTQIYNSDDPFCEIRSPDDSKWAVDHFYKKLFRLPATMNTAAGKRMAEKRVDIMKEYLTVLSREIAS